MNFSFSCIDIRDVASAHIIAMSKPEAASNRFILTHSLLWYKEIADIIREEFGPFGYSIKSFVVPKPIMWLMKFFDSSIKQVCPGSPWCS